MDDAHWRATYARLLKQIRDMQSALARAQEEAHVVRERAEAEGKKLRAVRTERRAIGRLGKPAGGRASEFPGPRSRRKTR